MIKCLNETQISEIISKYFEKDIQNKTLLGKEYGVLARTIGRILKDSQKVVWDYCVTKNEVTITRNDDVRTITNTFNNFKKLKSDLVSSDFSEGVLQETYDMMCMKQIINTFSQGSITVDHGSSKITYGDFEIKHSLVDHIFKLLEFGEDCSAMIFFIEKLLDNPDKNIIEQLYPFMEHNSISITKEGNILAYRGVTKDYKDYRTGKMCNKVGNIVKMPRNLVDTNPEQTCSSGLHVASIEYASSFGEDGRLLEVEVCPSKVCSVPVDYNRQKIRTCEFKVLREIK